MIREDAEDVDEMKEDADNNEEEDDSQVIESKCPNQLRKINFMHNSTAFFRRILLL